MRKEEKTLDNEIKEYNARVKQDLENKLKKMQKK